MNSEGKHTGHLSPDTIREYLGGKLSSAAMHQVEMHLLECGFCADAVEGFELSERSQVKTDLALLVLRKKLNEKIKEHERPRIIRWPAWSAAAAGIALAIAGYVVIKQQEKEEQLLAIQQSRAFLQTDANDTLLIFLPEDPEPVSSDRLLASNTRGTPPGHSSRFDPPARQAEAAIEAPPAASDTPQAAAAREIAIATAGDTAAQDSEFGVPAQGSAARAGSVRAMDTMQESLAMQPAEEDLEEVAAVSYSEKKMKTQVQATPAIGAAAYEKYLADSLRYPGEALEKRVEGEVVVRFTVRPSGRPAAFKILNSLGHGCDKEAIRLIEEGPDWVSPVIKGRHQPARAVQRIKFELPGERR